MVQHNAINPLLVLSRYLACVRCLKYRCILPSDTVLCLGHCTAFVYLPLCLFILPPAIFISSISHKFASFILPLCFFCISHIDLQKAEQWSVLAVEDKRKAFRQSATVLLLPIFHYSSSVYLLKFCFRLSPTFRLSLLAPVCCPMFLFRLFPDVLLSSISKCSISSYIKCSPFFYIPLFCHSSY